MSDPIYKSLDALEPAKKVVAEAAAGVHDKTRTISTTPIPEVLGAAGRIVAGVGTGLAAVYAAGTTGLSAVGITSGLATLGAVVGGGMVAGIFVAGAPMAALGLTGYGLLKWRNQLKLDEAKKSLFQDALLKRDAIQRELKDKVGMADDRTKYLDALNIKLREVIENLEQDLGKKAACTGGSA